MEVKLVYPFNFTFIDYPDNESYALLIHFLGCDLTCMNCINPKLRKFDFNEGVISFTVDGFINEAINILTKNNNCNKLVLTGGDPCHKQNIFFVKKVLSLVGNFIDVCIYTGQDSQYIKSTGLTGFKFLKCGSYVERLKQESKKTDTYIQFASKNQNLYDSNYNKISENGRYYFLKEGVS